MSDIFREIDEELRRDNVQKLWERYGGHVVALAVLIVLATAAVVGWREYQTRQRHAESVRYAAALELAQKNEPAKAADAFGVLAREVGGGAALLARFEEAALRAKSGDEAAAIASWKAIARDGAVDESYRDLATLLAALHEMKSGDPKAVLAELAPLTRDGNPWRPSALEATALAHLQAGDRKAALDGYKALADDLTAPQALRQRAAEMAAALAG
ncbi:MAG: tetratricopeptide repeat protein [Alphaproteobacteria bacterium]|nr:tetratricopeptide repeat protein [Alphaproteobacteria bacterium]